MDFTPVDNAVTDFQNAIRAFESGVTKAASDRAAATTADETAIQSEASRETLRADMFAKNDALAAALAPFRTPVPG